MSLVQGIGQFVDGLQSKGIPYAIIGGLAAFAYGGERTTFDVDLLIHGQHRGVVKQLAESLNLQVVNENAEVLQLAGTIQLDIIFANRPASQSMLGRIRMVNQFPYPVVAPEDLIGLKIQAFVADRSREFTDKGDILTILRNVPDVDFNKIKIYADVFGVWKEIEEIKKRV